MFEKRSERDVKRKAAVGEMGQQTQALGCLTASLRDGKHGLQAREILLC